MDESSHDAETPEMQPQHAPPALPDVGRPHAVEACMQPASAAPELTAAQPSPIPPDDISAASNTSVDAELPSTALHEGTHHQTAMQQPHTGADAPAPEQQPAAAVDSPAQAPEVASYEELAAFTSPVAAEMLGTGQLAAAQDEQPTHEPHAVPLGSSVHEQAAAADHNAVTSAPGGHSHVSHSHQESGQRQQETQHQGQAAAVEEGLNAPATHAPADLPFHPEQSLQEVQQAADDQLMHDADEGTSSAQRAAAEGADMITEEAAHMSELEGVRVDQAGAHSVPGTLQQNGRAPSAPAVRTLDDIMAQFEGPALPMRSAQLPAAAPAVPAQQHAEPRLAEPAEQPHPAHDAQDVHMADADQPELAQKGSIEAASEGITPQGKGSAKTGAGAARRQEIKPETDAGSVVWAKTKGYPWWPAQVLMIDDPWIPPDMEIPRRGAVPVRFFGTYNFTWIESQRNLIPFDLGRQEELASKGDLKVLKDGLAEAMRYLETGETPAGFSAMPASPEPAADEAGAKAGKRLSSATPRVSAPGGPGISKDAGKVVAARRKEAEKATAVRSAALQRRQRALRKLGLVPPPGSPYAEQPCLDVAQTWFAQALVEEQARMVRVAEQQRQMEERQKLQQQLFQRQLAAQMLHQQQLLQRAAAQHQQAQQEGAPAVWHPAQGFANPPAASAAMHQLSHQEQPAGQAQDSASEYEQGQQ